MKSREKAAKRYWEMSMEELREATKEFDEEFVAEETRPLAPQMRQRWEIAKSKEPAAKDSAAEAMMALHLDKGLLDRCPALAKKNRMSRDALIVRGLKALLAAEGQG
jgi:hypothetical protein